MASVVINDRALPALAKLREGLAQANLAPVIARAAVTFVQDHFRRLNRERPNRLGGRRTNFYSQAARNTSYVIEPAAVRVSVNQLGINQRIYGGEIHPTGGKKYLTIPAVPYAHGRLAGEFATLRFARFGRGPGAPAALVEAPRSLVKYQTDRKTGGIKVVKAGAITRPTVVFWLKRSVNQQADPSVLPDQQQLAQVVTAEAESYARTLKARLG